MIFTKLDDGISVEGAPIESFRSDTKASKYLYLIAGTHGDEVEGVHVLGELFKWMKEDSSAPDLPMIVLPILNPDGYRLGTRVNAHGVDLNRNYETTDWTTEMRKERYNPGPSPLSEPENKYLMKLFNKFPPAFIISFHSWKPIINYNGDSEDVATFLKNYNGYEMSEDIGYPTPGSLGTFIHEKYKIGVITFECPPIEDASLKEIWQQNEEGLKNLIKSDLLLKRLKN